MDARERWSLVAEMQRSEADCRIGRKTLHSTAAQVALQAGLADLWRSWGIVPTRIVGHSLGEIAAAYAAGALSIRDIALLTKARCEWQEMVDGLGGMAAVGLSEEDTARYLKEHAPELDIAGINAPTATTVSGAVAAIERLCAVLEREGIFNRQLHVTVPFHSRHLRERHERFAAICPPIDPRDPAISFVSATLGGSLTERLDSSYWLTSFEQPVRFHAAIKEILRAEARMPIFLEIGPHPVLAASVEECAQGVRSGEPCTVLPSIRRKEPERLRMLASLGRLFAAGQDPDFEALGVGEGALVSVPHYPWRRTTTTFDESEASRRQRLRADEHPLVGALLRDPNENTTLVGEGSVGVRAMPWLESHRRAGEILFPGAGFVEMMRASACTVLSTTRLELRDVSIEQPLVVDPKTMARVRTVVRELEGTIAVFSSPDAGSTWTRHATCRYSPGAAPEPLPRDGGDRWRDIDAGALYQARAALGSGLGPWFQTLTELKRGTNRGQATIRLPDETTRIRSSRRSSRSTRCSRSEPGRSRRATTRP